MSIPQEFSVGSSVTLDMGLDQEFIIGPPVNLGLVTIELPSGSNDYYIWNQTIAMATWTITHSFGRIPSVTIIDSTGKVGITDIEFPDNSTVIVTFASPKTGKALLV